MKLHLGNPFLTTVLRDRGWHIWELCHHWRRRWLSSWPCEILSSENSQLSKSISLGNPVACPPWLPLPGARTWVYRRMEEQSCVHPHLHACPPHRAWIPSPSSTRHAHTDTVIIVIALIITINNTKSLPSVLHFAFCIRKLILTEPPVKWGLIFLVFKLFYRN